MAGNWCAPGQPRRSGGGGRAPTRAAAVLAALAVAVALVVAVPAARASTGGSAEARAVGVDLAGLVLDVGGVEVPVLPGEPGVDLVEVGTPPTGETGNAAEEEELASISLFGDPPIEDVLNATVVRSESLRTTSGLEAASTIAGASVSLLGTELVSTGDITAAVACPVEGIAATPEAEATVVDLEVAGVPVAIGSVDIPVAIDVDVPGVVSATAFVSVTQVEAADADSAEAIALLVEVDAEVELAGGIIAFEGEVLRVELAAAACARPLAMEPAVVSLTPPAGPIGTEVTVVGEGFVPGATSIGFGELVVPAADVDVALDGEALTFLVPEGSPVGPTGVTVVTPGGEAGPLLFVVTPFAPVADHLTPEEGPEGTVVTVDGENFIPGATDVELGVVVIEDVDVAEDGTSLTFTVPPGTPLGPTEVVVVTPAGQTDPLGFLVTLPAPDVTGVDPASGPPGTTVTVTGDNFVPGGTTVELGGIPVDVTVDEDGTSLTFVVPPGAPAGPTTVTVATPGGSDTGLFTVTGVTTTTTAGGGTGTGTGTGGTGTGTGVSSTGSLPRTGAAVAPWVLGGALLLAGGLALAALARRRLAG